VFVTDPNAASGKTGGVNHFVPPASRASVTVGLATVLAMTFVGCGAGADPQRPEPPTAAIDQLILGDLDHDSVLVWLRAERAGAASVRVGDTVRRARFLPERDLATTLAYEDLRADTQYEVRVDGRLLRSFRTAPDPDSAAGVRFGFGGDVAGQNVCRHRDEGFPVFSALARRDLDFFVGLGDMIYGDDRCGEVGRYGQPQVPGEFDSGGSVRSYWAHWRYARDDGWLRRALARFPYVAVWDDHEVENDFGPASSRMSDGLRAFRDHNPVPARLYRSLRWGRHLELIVLDTRRYRDPSEEPDSDEDPKTMLGQEQRAWLERRLRSDASWKVVVSSVPMAIPTGNAATGGRDGWANYGHETGYERELASILEATREAGADVVWVTTDVHFATVLRYRPFGDDFVVHEVVTGPLNAGIYAHGDLDRSFHPERLFFHGPGAVTGSGSANADPPGRATDADNWSEAKRYFNWGEIAVSAEGALTLSVRGTEGRSLYRRTL
jgi:alkaline phosphatase D